MPSEPSPPWGRIDLFYQVNTGERARNRFFYDMAGYSGDPYVDGESFITNWVTVNEATFTNLWSEDVVALNVQATILTADKRGHVSLSIDWIGTNPGSSLPFQDCAVLTWLYPSSGGGARRTRGRTFVSGLVESAVDKGRITPSYLINVEGVANTLESVEIATIDYPLAIFSPSFNTLTAVETHYISPVVKTLRHRRPAF